MSLQDQEGWKNQERAYEQGLNVGKKLAQNKVLKLMDEVMEEYESQKPKNANDTFAKQSKLNAIKYTKNLIEEQIT